MKKKYNGTVNTLREVRRPYQPHVEIIKVPSIVVPFHSRGKDGLKVNELREGQVEEQCQGVGEQGILKSSAAVPNGTVIECLTCHTDLIPSYSS